MLRRDFPDVVPEQSILPVSYTHLSVIVMGLVVFCLRKELALLDVITLGKEQAINLGVDYDRCIRLSLIHI